LLILITWQEINKISEMNKISEIHPKKKKSKKFQSFIKQ
jgi:hypothetical protein